MVGLGVGLRVRLLEVLDDVVGVGSGVDSGVSWGVSSGVSEGVPEGVGSGVTEGGGVAVGLGEGLAVPGRPVRVGMMGPEGVGVASSEGNATAGVEEDGVSAGAWGVFSGALDSVGVSGFEGSESPSDAGGVGKFLKIGPMLFLKMFVSLAVREAHSGTAFDMASC